MAIETPVEPRPVDGNRKAEPSDPNQQSTTSLMAGILSDAQDLFKQHVHLLQAEVEQDLRETTQAGIQLVLGMATALIGALLLAFSLVELLKLAGLAPWAAYGLLGLVIAAVGGVLVAQALVAFQKINPLPEKSAEALKENLGWQNKPN
jgi:hypothetical protein